MQKLLTYGLAIIVVFFGALLTSDDDSESQSTVALSQTPIKPQFDDAYNGTDSWLIYWYVCGSNLESDYGAATADIQEMLNSTIPTNVRVLLQAGGSNQWKNAVIKSGQTNRLLYDTEGLHELEITADADMGSADTLADFLRYGASNFNADHKVFIFWDHGGGSAFGVCHDERTENILSLNDIRSAFLSVYSPSTENPPFELIGFDACLMATFDTANTLHGLTKFMVASEETEPGNGWEYAGWLNALGQNPAMGGDSLGRSICDTYYAGCKNAWSDDSATLSVINVSKMPMLRAAYDAFNAEALRSSAQNPRKFFSSLGRSANRSENYGGNTRESAYYDMVDIGDFAAKSGKLMPQTSQRLIDAVNDAVVYKVNGAYRNNGAGISGFYPYDGQDQIYGMYAQQQGATLPQKCLYYHLLYGVMPPEANDVLNGNYEIPPPQPVQKQILFDVSQLEDLKIQVDKDNNAFVTLNAQQMELLSSVHCNLAYVDTESEVALYLGSDADVKSDWDAGRFTDNFRAVWPMLDGHPVFVEIVEENENYNLYSIPIRLNGERVNLQVAYDFKTSKYKILGAKRLSKNGVADKNLIKLSKGDRLTTLHYGISVEGDDSDFTEVAVDTFTIDDNPKFEDEELGDGEYLYCFEFVTPDNESATSEFINFTVKGKEIFTTKLD